MSFYQELVSPQGKAYVCYYDLQERRYFGEVELITKSSSEVMATFNAAIFSAFSYLGNKSKY